MGLLNIGEEVGEKAVGLMGKKATGLMGSGIGKAAFGLGAAGLFAAGALKSSARSVIGAAGETAFDNPDADKAFMGEQGLSPSGVLDAVTSSGGAKAATGFSAGVGAIGGGLVGAAASKVLKSGGGLEEAVKVSSKVPLIGGKTLLKAGVESKSGGLIAAGAIAGAAIGAGQFVGRFAHRNKQFFAQSPYQRGSAMQASSTQAYGDVVLGMYNSRRG